MKNMKGSIETAEQPKYNALQAWLKIIDPVHEG